VVRSAFNQMRAANILVRDILRARSSNNAAPAARRKEASMDVNWASFSLISVELPIGEFVAKIREFFSERSKRKQDSKQGLSDDLRVVGDIVNKLTKSFIHCMTTFQSKKDVSDRDRLGAAIDEAESYLSKRELHPALIILTNDFKRRQSWLGPKLEEVWGR
jgi:hypothetical protein